ncbi:MAG TPA: peptidylprolyl isomerase [Tepidisphaeraceae bacterium]|jgi:peptidyl-prolyl cis-trans isomerase B (cyclophilin B)
MHAIVTSIVLYSVLVPTRNWFPADQPVNINIKSPAAVTLMLTDFSGQNIDPKESATAEVTSEKTLDLRSIFPLNNPGTYLLHAVPKGAALKDFLGTPLVIDVRADNRPGAPLTPMVIHVDALSYAVITTEKGNMTAALYYDAAPHTVSNFISLAQGGFYDGLTFDKIVKDFIIQGGDPRNDGTGGPGYRIANEFNDKQHDVGVLSMARQIDPNEPASPPRNEFANSAGSQFFICLNRENCKQLDRRYTAFGRVVGGTDVLKSIAQSPIADPQTGRPQQLIKITKIGIKPVTSKENPYPRLNEFAPTTTRPTTR